MYFIDYGKEGNMEKQDKYVLFYNWKQDGGGVIGAPTAHRFEADDATLRKKVTDFLDADKRRSFGELLKVVSFTP